MIESLRILYYIVCFISICSTLCVIIPLYVFNPKSVTGYMILMLSISILIRDIANIPYEFVKYGDNVCIGVASIAWYAFFVEISVNFAMMRLLAKSLLHEVENRNTAYYEYYAAVIVVPLSMMISPLIFNDFGAREVLYIFFILHLQEMMKCFLGLVWYRKLSRCNFNLNISNYISIFYTHWMLL